MTFDIFRQLKEGTADIHKQVEERVPVFLPGFDLSGYCLLLERFFGFWAPIELNLSRLSVLRDPELDLAGRLKSNLLAADLRILGRDPALVQWCGDLPAIDNFQRGLGCLYVLEGSTLGARFIARRLDEHLNLHRNTGASFFNAYGESTGQRWTGFKGFVIARVREEDAEEVVASARETFDSLYRWLAC